MDKQDRLRWRVGAKVPINVYAGDRPVCQSHTAEDAALIVESVNGLRAAREKIAVLEKARNSALKILRPGDLTYEAWIKALQDFESAEPPK